MATGLDRVFDHLQHAGGGLSDGQLLGRFVAARDEASFAALVRRHAPMVLGVCRRVLRDFHDAEDAFQATFFVLARKAASVVKRESLGCWLHQVAYHTALEASAVASRRRAAERQVKDMPHPQVAPAEAQDWRPLLDRELSRLPEKYRAAVVLCDLEGRTRKEAARLLGIPEGTLSSRLAAARAMLARRLTGCGLALSGGALASALAPGAASAQVPALLIGSTVRAAALVAAGQLAAVAPPAAVLVQGVMKAMLLKKLRLTAGAAVVLAALATVGVAYHMGASFGAAQAAPPEKPKSELEALRKENELLKLNLQVVLEKVQSQDTELREVRGRLAAAEKATPVFPAMNQHLVGPWNYNTLDTQHIPVNQSLLRTDLYQLYSTNVDPQSVYGLTPNLYLNTPAVSPPPKKDGVSDAAKEVECALKALREAKDKEGQRHATEALDKAMKKLKEQVK
jgi:RNA polymerase sigma factor (sigma-70 family)